MIDRLKSLFFSMLMPIPVVCFVFLALCGGLTWYLIGLLPVTP